MFGNRPALLSGSPDSSATILAILPSIRGTHISEKEILMGSLFDDDSEQVAALKAELALLKAKQDTKPSKSAEAERIGVHSSDPPRNFSQWMKFRRQAGDSVYRSRKVQDQIFRDAQILGKDAFYGND